MNTYMIAITFLYLLGFALITYGWAVYRHPGQKFLQFTPIWKASTVLKPPGVRLWWAGLIMMAFAAAWLLCRIGRGVPTF